MISERATLEGNIQQVGILTVVHPKVVLIGDTGKEVSLGERNVIEELSEIRNSAVGNGNLVEIGCVIQNSTIGNNNLIGPKCKIINSRIGNRCSIATAIELDGVTLPDDTSVYTLHGKWYCKKVDTSVPHTTFEMYLERLTNTSSAQYFGKNLPLQKVAFPHSAPIKTPNISLATPSTPVPSRGSAVREDSV